MRPFEFVTDPVYAILCAALAYKTAVAIGKRYNLEARESDRMLAAGYGHEITEPISYNLEATIPAKAARAPKAMTEIVELTTI